MSTLTFWTYDNTSKRAYVGRCHEFATAGEARAYERGYYDCKVHAPIIEPSDAYRRGWYDAEAEHIDRQDRERARAFEVGSEFDDAGAA